MNEEDFTDTEKTAVAYFFHRKPNKNETIYHYAIYVVPSLAVITSYSIHYTKLYDSGRIGVMIEFACETLVPFEDTEFSTFTREVAMHIAAENPKDISELLQQQFIRQPEITIKQLIDRRNNFV